MIKIFDDIPEKTKKQIKFIVRVYEILGSPAEGARNIIHFRRNLNPHEQKYLHLYLKYREEPVRKKLFSFAGKQVMEKPLLPIIFKSNLS